MDVIKLQLSYMNSPTVLKPSAQIAQISLISLKWHHITSITVDGSRRGGSGSHHSRNLVGGYLKQQLEMTVSYAEARHNEDDDLLQIKYYWRFS